MFGDEIALISWEDEHYAIIEQYNEDDVLIDKVVVNKAARTIDSSYDEEYEFEEPVIQGFYLVIPSAQPMAFNKIDTVKVYNPLIFPTTVKTMYVFENYTTKLTTYTIPSGARTVAQLVAAILVALAIPTGWASELLYAVVSGGAGLITGAAVNMFFNVTVAAEQRSYSYYGKDSVTSQVSKNYQCGTKYLVKDQNSKYMNKLYTSANTYKDSASAKSEINNALCQNLYGVSFEYSALA